MQRALRMTPQEMAAALLEVSKQNGGYRMDNFTFIPHPVFEKAVEEWLEQQSKLTEVRANHGKEKETALDESAGR